jgi:hypothetical protein
MLINNNALHTSLLYDTKQNTHPISFKNKAKSNKAACPLQYDKKAKQGMPQT